MSAKDPEPQTRRDTERKRLQELVDKRPKDDTAFRFSGVLLSDAIKQCCDAFGLITPLNEANLKPANYKLRIGDEFAIRGKIYAISDTPGENQIRIAPFDVAVIKTLETINMPRFLIGRWNIQVSKAYKGLLWVGGPQVDAGYVGNLFCPIYNLSDEPVTLFYGDPIAVIDFEKTTEFHEGTSKTYPGVLPDRILFQDYEPESLKSALATQVEDKINTFGGRLDFLSSRIDVFVGITVALLGILFAAGAVFLTEPDHPHWWEPGIFWICVIAVALSGWAVLRPHAIDSGLAQSSRIVLWIIICAFFGIGLTWEWRLQNQINDLKANAQKSSLNAPENPNSPARPSR
jgi:deoxycytidine triphosphate deaminase